ncbi:hypothetical protein [Mycobacterium sp.]|uniref:hypothetical protein n=1 Tax=Mycobacterium sp. TaxID=1785 RepID=UPI0025DAB486|nr:hypothetical protein [Mycobacterium sp.]
MNDDTTGDPAFTVGCRVRLRADSTQTGEIVDDFGVLPYVDVVVGDVVISARRWAVLCDSGQLRFVDSAGLESL